MIEITQHSKGNSRHYKVTGDDRVPEDAELPSVTTVLGILSKPWLLPWYKNLVAGQIQMMPNISEQSKPALMQIAKSADDLARDSAANEGTEAHKLIENYLATGQQPQPALNAPAVVAFYAFREWEEQSGIRVTLSEQMVYHPYLSYAGTIDAVGEDEDGKYILLDWKSGNRIYNEAGTQLAAYAVAFATRYGYLAKDTRAICVRIDKNTGKFEAKEVRSIEEEFSYFTQLLAVYNNRNRKVWR